MCRPWWAAGRRLPARDASTKCFVAIIRRASTTRDGSRSRTDSARSIESQWGLELFVTSVTGEFVRLYPMAVWLEIERSSRRCRPRTRRSLRFLDRVNFFGQVATMDRQGRRDPAAAARDRGDDGRRERPRPAEPPRGLEPEAPAGAASRRSPSPTTTAGCSRSMGSDAGHVPVLLAEALELLAVTPGGLLRRRDARARRPRRGGAARVRARRAPRSASTATARRSSSRASGSRPSASVRGSCTPTTARSRSASAASAPTASCSTSASRSLQLDDRRARLQLPARRPARHAHGQERAAAPPSRS